MKERPTCIQCEYPTRKKYCISAASVCLVGLYWWLLDERRTKKQRRQQQNEKKKKTETQTHKSYAKRIEIDAVDRMLREHASH